MTEKFCPGNELGRRNFLKILSLVPLAATIPPKAYPLTRIITPVFEPATEQQRLSHVIIATHADAVQSNSRLNGKIIREMLDQALMELTGASNLKQAWLQILPDLHEKHIIGIKVNCINRSLSSHPQVVMAIVEGLKITRVNENNIIIWDRQTEELKKAGFHINTSTTGVRCFGTDTEGIGFDRENKARVNGKKIRLSKILTRMCDHLINVPVLKNHGTTGVTLSLKNHYGSIPLGDNLPWSVLDVKTMHAHQGDPQIAYLNATPMIRNKTRLVICDALLGIYRGGPGGRPQWAPKKLIVSQDPVAADYQGMMLIEEKRKQEGVGSIVDTASHIKTAARLGLGTDDPERMEVKVINLG